eukprot:scaffold2416_cov102-Isochrysis_galbana.AAC.2
MPTRTSADATTRVRAHGRAGGWSCSAGVPPRAVSTRGVSTGGVFTGGVFTGGVFTGGGRHSDPSRRDRLRASELHRPPSALRVPSQHNPNTSIQLRPRLQTHHPHPPPRHRLACLDARRLAEARPPAAQTVIPQWAFLAITLARAASPPRSVTPPLRRATWLPLRRPNRARGRACINSDRRKVGRFVCGGVDAQKVEALRHQLQLEPARPSAQLARGDWVRRAAGTVRPQRACAVVEDIPDALGGRASEACGEGAEVAHPWVLGAHVLPGLLLLILVHKTRLVAPSASRHGRAAAAVACSGAVATVGLEQLPHPLVLAHGGRGRLLVRRLGLSVELMLGVCIRARPDRHTCARWVRRMVRIKIPVGSTAGRRIGAGGRRIDPRRRAGADQAGLGRPELPRPIVSLWGLERVKGVLPRQLAAECAHRPRPRELRALGRHE